MASYLVEVELSQSTRLSYHIDLQEDSHGSQCLGQVSSLDLSIIGASLHHLCLSEFLQS